MIRYTYIHKFFKIFICVCLRWCAHECRYPWRPEEVDESLDLALGVLGGRPCVFWELNLEPLGEQQALACKPCLEPLFVVNSMFDCTSGTMRHKENGVGAEKK